MASTLPDQIHNSVFRDNIAGNRLIEADQHVRRIVDAQEFQRLRHIRQMGLASYVFPTAEHSRFAHSLGVYATAKAAYQHLRLRSADLDLPFTVRFGDEVGSEFCIASLCHDLGHTPFSHVLENTLLPEGFRSHEECTLALLSTDRTVGKAINRIADLEAVRLFLSREHINKALTVLVSGSFDVDRADYILRDSYMSGVNYGQYDLNWLFHSMAIETNKNEQPILVLDGRRGLDSLRQFLSARRYLYRQVYYHSAVRAAQVLLKAIFDRIQDLPRHSSTKALAPLCFKKLATGSRPSIGEFLAATGIEVLYMVRTFALEHKDETLRYLCKLFLERQLPKAALDSAKSLRPLSRKFQMEFSRERQEPPQQLQLAELLPPEPAHIDTVLADVRDFVSAIFKSSELPPEAARYLVVYDPAMFEAGPLNDIRFSFEGKFVPLPIATPESIGFDITALLGSFTLTRLFVPRNCVEQVKEYIDRRYAVSDTSATSDSGEDDD